MSKLLQFVKKAAAKADDPLSVIGDAEKWANTIKARNAQARQVWHENDKAAAIAEKKSLPILGEKDIQKPKGKGLAGRYRPDELEAIREKSIGKLDWEHIQDALKNGYSSPETGRAREWFETAYDSSWKSELEKYILKKLTGR